MKLIHLPKSVIVNLDHLTHARRNANGSVALYLAASGGKNASGVLVKERADDLWNYLVGKCGDDEDFSSLSLSDL